MNYKDKVLELKRIINKRISSYIDNDVVLLDNPYHGNLGDSLIWAGDSNFINSCGHKILWQTSLSTFDGLRKISPHTIIVFNGGGNFGDVWRECNEFRIKIVESYPNNRILMLPQSVWYNDEKLMHLDSQIFSHHKNLIICARDLQSYKILKENFHNEIILAPDMAFFMPSRLLKIKPDIESKKVLFLRRTDKELSSSIFFSMIPSDATVNDWPTIVQEPELYTSWKQGRGYRFTLWMKNHGHPQWVNRRIDRIWQKKCLPFNVNMAIDYISKFSEIYSTRLHASLLGLMLGKKVVAFDNSYGKTSSFYHTWLEDCNNISLATESIND